MKIILRSILLLIFTALPSFGDSKVVTFADLPIGDTIVATYSSLGCFHSYAFEFTYSRSGEGSFEVQELLGPPLLRKRLGLILLERGEAKTLDNWIATYRNRKSEIVSSTTTSFRLVQLHEGRVVKEESIQDGSDLTGEDERHNYPITFDRMAFDLKKRELKRSNESD